MRDGTEVPEGKVVSGNDLVPNESIPEDVMQAAQDTYDRRSGAEKYDVVYIAEAIFAERKRWAVRDSAMRHGIQAALRAAKLALFVIRKQGVMPNSSWESGLNSDIAMAEAALSVDMEMVPAPLPFAESGSKRKTKGK